MNAEPTTAHPRIEEAKLATRLPAVRSSDYTLQEIARLGQWLAAAESESKDPAAIGAAAALRLALARELGLPLTAASELSMIKGRLTLGATLLRALAVERGYRVKRIEGDDESCTAAVVEIDTGEEVGRSTFTIEQAKRRGLIKDRGNWQTMPERMLWARATTEALRDYAPEVMVGLTAAEEADEFGVEQRASYAPEPTDSTERFEDEAQYEPEPAEPDESQPSPPMSDAQRRKLFAMIGDLDKRFPPPLVDPERPEGAHFEDWKSVAVDSAAKHYDKELSDLSKSDASDLIERVQARLLSEERKVADRQADDAAADAELATTTDDADDIPF